MFSSRMYDFDKLLLVLIPTIILFAITFYLLKGKLERLLFTMFFGGFFFYSGIGYGYKVGVADNYATYFIIFSCIFCFCFIFFSFNLSTRKIDFAYINNRLTNIFEQKWLVQTIIIVYLSSFLLDLVYPEFKLVRLVSPPAPDILADLIGRFDGAESKPLLTVIVSYFRFLLYPFYIVVLIKQVHKIPNFIALLFIPLYLEYCSNAYIGRSVMLLSLIFLFMMLWKFRPEIRKRMIIITSVVVPAFILFSFFYQVVRNKGNEFNGELSVTKAAEVLINTETSLPVSSGRIIDENERVDLVAHLTWMTTIAIPKFGLIKVENGLAGYEMAELIVGKERTSPGFWVPLSGYLTENVYVYGKNFFWIPAVVIAFLLSLIGKVLNPVPLLYGFALFLGLTFAYNLNRAGIGSALLLLLNNNLFMIGLIFLLINKIHFKWSLPNTKEG